MTRFLLVEVWRIPSLSPQSRKIGDSLLEEDKVELAADILKQAEEKGVKLPLPVDNVIADAFSAEANTDVIEGNIPDEWMSLDIGPKTIELYAQEIANAKTVVWNGPMGCFEMAPLLKEPRGSARRLRKRIVLVSSVEAIVWLR